MSRDEHTNKLSQDELREIATKALELAYKENRWPHNLLDTDFRPQYFFSHARTHYPTLAQAVLDQSAEIERLRAALKSNADVLEKVESYLFPIRTSCFPVYLPVIDAINAVYQPKQQTPPGAAEIAAAIRARK